MVSFLSSKQKTLIIGAGFTGLGAGLVSNASILEAKQYAGGICASYSKSGFKFEIGGGHWIFGGDQNILDIIKQYSPCNNYFRKSAVFFAGNLDETIPFQNMFIDYPIQNHLNQLGKENAKKILKEIFSEKKEKNIITMEDWLKVYFGQSLFEIFFKPFHEKYTANLYKEIAPQDPYKSPLSAKQIIEGAFENDTTPVGYNTSYLYPINGLDHLANSLAKQCNINYEAKVESIDVDEKVLTLATGKSLKYNNLISTIPLNKLLEISKLTDKVGRKDPYTSVLVLNIGAEIPTNSIANSGNHWLYIPDSLSGFHRVGYYSNVDPLFLPKEYRNQKDKYASIYVEFAFKGGSIPDKVEIDKICESTIEELKNWNFIKKEIIVDPTIIDVAYTWSYPDSTWVSKAQNILKDKNIYSAGRFGRWTFQGIAESLKEGLIIGAAIKAKEKSENKLEN